MTNTALTIPGSILAVDKTKLQTSKDKGLAAVAKLAPVPCTTPEHESAFADYMNRAHIIVQELEAERETMVRPLIDQKSEIDGLYRDARDPWSEVKALCKNKIAEAQNARRKAQDEARRLAVTAAQAGDTQACAAALVSAPVASKPEGAGVSWEWTYEVADYLAIPRHYLVLSESVVKSHMKTHAKSETIPEVPGLKFVRKAKVGVR